MAKTLYVQFPMKAFSCCCCWWCCSSPPSIFLGSGIMQPPWVAARCPNQIKSVGFIGQLN